MSSTTSSSGTTALATFGGMASGLPVQQLIDATINADSTRLNKYKQDKSDDTDKQAAYKAVQAKYNTLKSSLQTVTDSRLIYAFDLFDRKTATSSDNSVATVSTSKGAMDGSVELKVNSLATPPTATIPNFGAPITKDVNIYELGVIDEPFSLTFQTPSGGVCITAQVVSGDTLETYVNKLNASIASSGKLTGSIGLNVDANGQATLDFSTVQGGTLNQNAPFGSSRSNLADVFGFAVNGNTLVSKPISFANLDGKLSDNSVGIKGMLGSSITIPQKINIGGLDITITANTTMRSIMNTINESSVCQVTASYQSTNNTFTFKAKDNFYSDYIYFSGSDFLSQVGLTDSNGVVKQSAQTQRASGEIVLNGKTISIKSNKVTAADTGLEGVTINLKAVSTATADPVKIAVSDNTDDLVSAINNVVKAYNDLVSTISSYTYVNIDTSSKDAKTTDKGALSDDYSLTSQQMTMQMKLMSPTDEKLSYKALAVIGFSTDSGKINFDKTKFLNALSDNSADIKKLLVGNNADNTTGIFGSITDLINQYTDVQNGFFAIKANSLSDDITQLNQSITDEQARLDQERTRLTNQYSNLDSIISKYQSASASLTSAT